jgi:uncharacterized protein (TIGR03032 family)
MRLASEFLQLPLSVDASRLADEIGTIPETSWRPHPQGNPGNTALPLVAAHGDPANEATKGPMLPTPHLAELPYLRQVLAAFDAPIGRSRLMRIDGNGEAVAHADTNYYWFERVRIHVPVVTTPGVRFLCGEREVHMAAGEVWIFDTWRRHNVLNPDETRRIHLVVDTVGSPAFWNLVSRGRDPFGAPSETPFAPRQVPFVGDRDASFPTETVNQPVVMSPWELRALLAPLRHEIAAVTDREPGLRATFLHLLDEHERAWHALWASHGERPDGWPVYRAHLASLEERLGGLAKRLWLPNRVDVVEAIRQCAIRPAVNPDLAAATPAAFPAAPATGTTDAEGAQLDTVPASPESAAASQPTPGAPVATVTATRPVAARPAATGAAPRFARPIFIVCPPRSGSSLLFETLATSPEAWTIGGESHALIEGVRGLHPAARGWSSNRLEASDATVGVREALVDSFARVVRNRDGALADPAARELRLLEKTPKNALRVPFLAAAFPDAQFLYLYRDPRETISSILDAWHSGRFVTYPQLPGWTGPPWSLLLVPGWRELAGRPLAEIAARQWQITTEQLLDDLEALAPDRWAVASFDRLVAEPQAEIERLCSLLDLAWDRILPAVLPVSKTTLTSPAPEKWKHNAAELKEVMPLAEATAQRARAVFARPPAIRPPQRRDRTTTPATVGADRVTMSAPRTPTGPSAPAAGAFASSYTASVPQLLRELGASLAISTYQSGRVILARVDGDRLNTHLRSFASPMGIAVGRHLAIGTKQHVWRFENQPAVAARLDPPGRHDAVFLPRNAQITGDIRIHELAFAGDELWLVNTRFSCLCTLDGEHSFVPRWRPPFVTALAAEDRCHLNGLAVRDNQVRWVTALGTTDTPAGWREHKAAGGVLLEVPSGRVVASGLSMPHSPRWHAGRLWLLESGKGTLATVDPATGTVTTIAELPGFTRGLAFAGPYAFVGLSQVRETVFDGIPIATRPERRCGVWVVDVRSGQTAGFLRFEGNVQEIFDVQLLRARWPELVEPDADLVATSFAVPPAALSEVAR